MDETRAVFSSPEKAEKAEKALASAAAEIQALCESCRAALVVKTQYGTQLVTANFDDKERRRRATRGLKVDLKAPKRKPPKPFPENIFKESAEHLPSWSKGVLSTLREGNEGLDEMERFANRVKDVDEKLKVLEEQAADLKSEPELDDLQEIKPMVVRRKDSISMMRRWSRSISPDDSGNPFVAELPRQGSRRTAHVANFQNSLDPPRRSESYRARGPSKDSDLSSTRSKSSARNAVMTELDGLLDHLTKDPAEEGFSAAEVTRLRAGFKRFMMPGTIDVHKDDVFELLTFLGCVFLDPLTVRDLMDKTTRFDHLGFDDFEAFMGKYTRYCQSQYQVIFDQFDADESGTISMEELREMTHHLGFMPTRLMLEEAVEVACRSRRAAALSFNELVQFLMIYRRREGFCREEVDKLRGIHNDHSEGNPPVMPVSELSTALIQAFGRQVTRLAGELQDQLASGQILPSSQVSPDPDFEPEKLSFSEFLIMSRNCREVLHRKLDCMWPRDENDTNEAKTKAKAAISQQGLAIKCNPGGEGTITDEELREVLRDLGYMPLTKAMLDIYNDVIGSPVPRDLDYDEFFDFVWRFRSNCGFSSDELEDMQELYRLSDEDNSGEICALELATMFRSLGYRATMEDLSGMVLEVDHGQSGFLSFSEFMILMGDFRALELKKIYRVFDDLAVGGYLQAENITKACKRVGSHLIDSKHMPDEDDEFDFEDFVDWVDECRHDCMMRERKLAGFGWWKVECFRESFKEFDKNGNGHLEPDELIRLMRHLNISESPKTKADQKALLKLLETARKNAYEAGIREAQLEPGNSISFWTFVQLLRLLQTQKEKRQMDQLNELMEELRFSKFEVEQFRQIFVRWARYDPVEGMSDREIDTDVETLSEEQLHRIFRSAGVSLVGEGGRIRELQVGLEPLQSGGRLSFENFLKLMRWVLDTNFANLGTSISR